MFQHILVPLDGSLRAESALPAAARLARVSGGSVILLRVVTTATEYWPATAAIAQPSIAQSVADADLTGAEQYLAALSVSPVLREIALETVVLFGAAAPTILSAAYSYSADIIVMCSHGYSGMKRWVLGSVAEKVARHSAIPVFILHEGGPIPAHAHPDPTQPMRALVTLDGSAYAKAALIPAAQLIAALAGHGLATLHLVRVVKTHAHDEETEGVREEHAPLVQKAMHYLEATAEHLREGLTATAVAHLKLPITWSVTIDTDVAEGILHAAEGSETTQGTGIAGHSDVIVMATHGRGGMQRWAMGSITERVLNTTKLPILIVRPPEMTTPDHHGKEPSKATMH